jgi:hypothetical protein
MIFGDHISKANIAVAFLFVLIPASLGLGQIPEKTSSSAPLPIR